MRKPLIAISAAFVSGLWLAGCGTTAVITDFSDGITEVHHVKTSPLKKRIKILHGDAVRILRLRDIDKISIFPAGSRVMDGQVYYQAGILLDSGEKIGYATNAEETWADTYICIDGMLSGEAGKGGYSIGYDKIMEMEIKSK